LQKKVSINSNLKNVAKMYSKMADILKVFESNLKKEKSNLNWEISQKIEIDNDIDSIINKVKEFRKLNNEISHYINSTVDSFEKVDKMMANKLKSMDDNLTEIMVKSLVTSSIGGFTKTLFNPNTYSSIKDWFKTMRYNAGSNDIDTGKSKGCGDPVNIATGNFITRKVDLYLGGYNPIEFVRFYNSIDFHKGSMGYGWHHSYEIVVEKKENIYTIVFGDGRIEEYIKEAENFTSMPGNRNILKYDNNNNLELVYPEGDKINFDTNLKLSKLIDRNGNITKLNYGFF
jgi:hypothetical protein